MYTGVLDFSWVVGEIRYTSKYTMCDTPIVLLWGKCGRKKRLSDLRDCSRIHRGGVKYNTEVRNGQRKDAFRK